MEPLQPAVSGPSFRYRADLLPSPTARRVRTPRKPPQVSYRKLLARVHNPELRKAIVAERQRVVARKKRAMAPSTPPQKQRMQTPPTPDISEEWAYYQSGEAWHKRKLKQRHTSRESRAPCSPPVDSLPMPVPLAATTRLEARHVARAFDKARATREFWSQPVRKPALRPPVRVLSDAERRMRNDAPGLEAKQTPVRRHPWRARW